MHASSIENMYLCYDRFISGSIFESKSEVSVLDVGGSDYNGSYREVFSHERFSYTAADISEGHGVQLVIQDPYRLPIDDRSIDIVISGQMLEHCEFFWLAFGEMVRVLRPGGFIFLIAPSAGPEHRYPVDCYRFYPDAFRALARHANCAVVDIWRDDRGPWQDLVGVFSRHGQPPHAGSVTTPSRIAPIDVQAGSAEEERIQGSAPYLQILAQLHASLNPANYLEIGIRHGASLSLAQGPAVGVDPAPDITYPLHLQTTIVTKTSDAFFADATSAAAPAPDLIFIDGLHHADAALRDFMNVERSAAPGALVILDDILPNHPAQAMRERCTRVWTGDVWKLVPLLRRLRPDLAMVILDTAPSGLLLIGGLDPENRILRDQYNPIIRELRETTEPPSEVLDRIGAVSPNSPAWEAFLASIGSGSGTPVATALRTLADNANAGGEA
jgi:SAM-dependent methyltransferase